MLPKTEKQEVTGMKWTSKSYELCIILEDAYFFRKSIRVQSFSCNHKNVFVGLPVYDTFSFGRQDAYP